MDAQAGAPPIAGESRPNGRVPIVQDDREALQEPPPMDRPAASIFQVPDMELPATEPE